MITLSPCELLTYAKKIILYMCRNHEERLLNELLNELQITESLNISLERTDTLPFYRFNYSQSSYPVSSNGASSTLSSGTSTVRKSSMTANGNEHRGLLHTKRHHSGEDAPSQEHVAQLNTVKMRTSSQNSLSASLNDRISTEMEKGTDDFCTISNTLRFALISR